MIIKGPKVFVCGRNDVSEYTSKHDVTHIVSIKDKDTGKSAFFHPHRKVEILKAEFDDVEDSRPSAPKYDDIQRILDWTKNLTDNDVLLVHCEAGISRSTAIALSVLVQHNGKEAINDCVDALIDVRPHAGPNCLIAQFADLILNCKGLLLKAAEDINLKYMRTFFGYPENQPYRGKALS